MLKPLMNTFVAMRKFLAMSLLLLLVNSHLSAQRRCEECARRAILDEFTNPNNPDYEQKREEWRQCMQAQLGDYVSFNADDPIVNSAAEKCEQFEPTDHAYCFPAIVAAFLGEHLTNPCFHMLSLQYFNPDMHRNPEYLFRGSYEGNLEGGQVVEIVTDTFKPIVARMKMQLYYNGNSPELVHEWNSEGTLNSPKGLLHKLNLPENISPMLEEFEMKPVSIDVEVPAQEELCEKGKGIIVLSGFKDESGRASREFNRIVVSIYKGKIMNGADSDYGPDYKVFTVGDGEVRIEYQPPEEKNDGYEWLRVYNSCDILPKEKHPLSRTIPDELIIDQHFPIFCGFYKGTITITQSWDYADDYGNSYIGSKTVTCKGTYKSIEELRGKEGQPFHWFGPSNVVATWEIKEDMYCGGDAYCPGHCRQEFGQGTLAPDMWQELTIMTWVFPLEIKEVADQLGEIGMENYYVISVAPGLSDVITETREKRGDPCVWNVKQSEEDIPGAIIQYKLVDVDELKGHQTWKSKHGATGYSIEITDMPDFQGEHVEPLKPVPDGTDYTYTVTWNLISL